MEQIHGNSDTDASDPFTTFTEPFLPQSKKENSSNCLDITTHFLHFLKFDLL